MSGNKYIWMLTLSVVMLVACQTYQIPGAYNFSAKEVKTSPYGCWCKLTVSPGTELFGEFICTGNDTVYLLVHDFQIQEIPSLGINQMEVYTHGNQAGKYGLITSAFLIPNVIGALAHVGYALEFFALGIPVATVGIVEAIIEGKSTKNVITKSGQKAVSELRIYARYPAGKPEGIDLHLLTLKR